ncbi:hypothetical protein GFH48_08455 [Streptomyces fagopyri]|uniref:Vegetative cell wall protein gp1 n=1 Tax=Streptomyces fagopyri TaxID=2662397 RepID=A0A5Q0L8C9_9ACTN|nr:hypothetical protein [Streptomyces fagopyri]QFZ73290.1 hypothetical protein GFH48_08455 [Streptomyces fagopyri]
MNAVLAELGKSLAARWLTHLVPSGLLFLAVAGAGRLLGQAHWYDVGRVTRALDELAGHPASRSTGGVVLAVSATVVASAGLGLAAQALGGVVERCWTGDWQGPARMPGRRLTERRRRKWRAAEDAYARVEARAVELGAPLGPVITADLARLAAARNRISLEEPVRPCWIGDRVRALDRRIHRAYRLDLDSAWSRLWLVLSGDTRAELRGARDVYDAAVRLTAWSLPYLLVAVLWWPAALIALGVAAVGLRRGRSAMDAFAELVESAVDLHGRELALALGVPCPDRLDREAGAEITAILRKGV